MNGGCFTPSERAAQQAALDSARIEHPAVIEEARARGFRLAEMWEREWYAPEDLFCWRGTIWIRLEPAA